MSETASLRLENSAESTHGNREHPFGTRNLFGRQQGDRRARGVWRFGRLRKMMAARIAVNREGLFS